MGRMSWGSVCLLFIVCLCAPGASATTPYTVTELHAPCSYMHPLEAGIGNAGHVVAEWCVDNYSRGYIWQGGSATDLGHLGGGACFPLAVNGSGQVTGK